MTDSISDARKLVEHYTALLELYHRLETISRSVFEAIENRSQLGTVQAKLREKMAVVENIQEQSQKIAALKETIRLSRGDREQVKRAEEELTTVVKRVVEQEDRSRELFQKQGLKISRI